MEEHPPEQQQQEPAGRLLRYIEMNQIIIDNFANRMTTGNMTE